MKKMWKFQICLLLISLLNQRGNGTALLNCDCEADRSPILERINNQLEMLNNEIYLYRLENFNERFYEIDERLKSLSQKTCIADKKSEFLQVEGNTLMETKSEEETEQNQDIARCKSYPRNCAEITADKHQSGLLFIKTDFDLYEPSLVYCEQEIQGGGWIVVQRRKDGSVDFYRDWAYYKNGFGNFHGEFFIGMDRLHALTTDTPQELLIVMTDFSDTMRYAKYDAFAIGDESEQYALKTLGAYSGDAGDSLSYHVGQKFTTKNRDNDRSGYNCAITYTGAWWHENCLESNLNGQYLNGSYFYEKHAQGVLWKTWLGYEYSLKTVQMLIRPKRSATLN